MTADASSPPHTRLWLRRARAVDRAAVRAFLHRLSPDTVRARYLSHAMNLAGPSGDRELARLLERDEARHVVVLAVDGAEVRGIGEFVNEHGDRADLGLVVEDAFQERGVGRRLLGELEQLALARGIRAFTGDVAYGNARVVALLRATGRPLHLRPGDGSVRFTLQLES